jgi:hypothetical protein
MSSKYCSDNNVTAIVFDRLEMKTIFEKSPYIWSCKCSTQFEGKVYFEPRFKVIALFF